MVLSEKEKQLLAQLEASLAAEDPELASTLRTGTKKKNRIRSAVTVVLFVVGVVVLVAGLKINPIISVIGFVIMLISAVIGITSWQPRAKTKKRQKAKGPAPEDNVKLFMEKMEERWRKRQEGGM